MFSHSRGLLALITILWLTVGSIAQSVVAANFTSQDSETFDVQLSFADAHRFMTPTAVPLSPLTQTVGDDLPSSGLSGPAVLGSTTPNLDSSDIVLISCDSSDYSGYITVGNLINAAENANVAAIVFYSQHADYCSWSTLSADIYAGLYTLQSRNDSQQVLSSIEALQSQNNGSAPHVIIERNSTGTIGGAASQTGSAAASSSSAAGYDGGPPPSTAVAMIILYSITGIITCLFLVIIITGAVKAHRHPERYGPRNILGRARQSRAQGLARAMLDSLPIVKFGEQDKAKRGDVELASGDDHGQVEAAPTSTESNNRSIFLSVATNGLGESETRVQPVVEAESGIAAAASDSAAVTGESHETEGCSICTEDFELGQDQRVLPCNHRFHPACIDPWLLNVSGTCPLCRIDLRPQDASTDEGLNRDSTNGMAPPLGLPDNPAERERLSVRRSLMLSIMGMGQPERMSRQQRVLALREYNRRRAREEQGANGVAAPGNLLQPEDELSTRRRLRNAFRIRTRRTGQAVDGPGQPGEPHGTADGTDPGQH